MVRCVDPRQRWKGLLLAAAGAIILLNVPVVIVATKLTNDATKWSSSETLDAAITLNSLADAVNTVGICLNVLGLLCLGGVVALRQHLRRVPVGAEADFATTVARAVDALSAAVREAGDLEARRTEVERKTADLEALVGVSAAQVSAIGRAFGPTGWRQWWIMFALAVIPLALTAWQIWD